MFATRVLLNRRPPGRTTSRISITTITGLEKSPPKTPAMPARVVTCESSWPSRLCRAIQLPAPPPMVPSTFSGPTLAPPISDTTETAMVPGTSPGSTCSGLQVFEQAGNRLGQLGQLPQHADHEPRRRGDGYPPPVSAEPAWIGSRVPPGPQLDHSQDNQAGEPAEHSEGDRVRRKRPELSLLGNRRNRGRPGHVLNDKAVEPVRKQMKRLDVLV